MKRLNSTDSLGGFMSSSPNPTVDVEFETMLEEEGQIWEKKRRLSAVQVKALEKNFEVENKLEPERKVKLAEELGLQPRQVAVWFQNRRARWKTKQLERDYGLLKANHDALKLRYESLHRENQSLLNQISELKSELNVGEGKITVKEDASPSELEEKYDIEIHGGGAAAELNFENCDGYAQENEMMGEVFVDFKDGSDSDSSAILNEDNNNSSSSPIASSVGILHRSPQRFEGGVVGEFYQTQLVKIEEHNFFGEESCSTLFSDDQPPTLHWYFNDQWN